MKTRKEIIAFFDKTIKKPYYYVPPCPVCGSKVTGKLIKHNINPNTTDWEIDEALRNGEIVYPIPKLGEQNCICMECGSSWRSYVPLRMFSLKRIKQEKEDRHTEEMYAERVSEALELEKSKSGLFHTIARFVGK